MRTLTVLYLIPLAALGADASQAKPNIVYILADDLGYGDVGCYNASSRIPTPNLDRLAAMGIRFTDAHASDAVCSPTRYGVLTGRYCFRSRLKAGVLPPWGEPLIERNRLTVPELLRRHGYATACIGKWHLGWTWPSRNGKPPLGRDGPGNIDFTQRIADGPTTRGFDTYFGVDLPNYPPYCFIENDRTVGIPSVPAPMTPGGINRPGPMVPGWKLMDIMPELTRRAIGYIERSARANSDKPFFLYFALTAPHYPVVPAFEFRGRSHAGDYGDFVTQVDWTVGQVLAALSRTGLTEKTLVMFTSDNGPECVEVDPGAYDRVKKYGHRSMEGLRGVKRDAWEGGHRVPFLARWPGQIPAGSVSDETICHVDLMATCAAILGATLPPDTGVDSYNILPALCGQRLQCPIREATVLHSGNGKFVLRQGPWVLIDARSGDDNGDRGEPDWLKQARGYAPNSAAGELYDLRNDLPQRANLYAQRPEIVKRLKVLLEKYKADGRSTPGPPQPETRHGPGRTSTNMTDEK
jgi:arylsulfatase A-like enzyme